MKRVHPEKFIKALLVVIVLTGFNGCQMHDLNKTIDVSELTISDIHKAYNLGEYNSRQLAEAYIERIKQLDEKINAITVINPDALSIAERLDDEYRRTGLLRPLHGIPIIVKDNINTACLPTTAGSLALRDFIPGEDAFIIQRLVEAGAIIIAKSNMAEWAFSPMHTESSTTGITRNPYNTDYVPAGSSGGTAAAVASNFGAAGLGTDTGNSIRGPSSHCALVGFRTTMGLVSRSAIVPLYLRNDVVGPMCRTVEDATRVLDVIAGYDPDDPLTEHSIGKIPETYLDFLKVDGLKGSRIGVLRQLSDNKPDEEVIKLFEKAISDLESLGASVIDPVVIPGFSSLRKNQWCATFRTDLESFLAEYVKRDTLKTLEDIIRIGCKSQYVSDRLKFFAGDNVSGEDTKMECLDAYNDSRRLAFREAIEEVMDSLELDALIYPSWNNKPAHIEYFEEEYQGDNSQVIAPHTGQPAFTVPMGFTSGDLPAGLQFLGRMYDEPTLIKMVYAFEQGTKHRKQPALK